MRFVYIAKGSGNMIDFEYLMNPEKYHTVPPRAEGEKDEQYKARLKAYVQGVESQQAKIDLLEKELTETQAFLNKQNHIKQTKIDELQTRVDKAMTQVNNHKHSCEARKRIKRMSASVSEIAEIEAHESNMYVLENILKGNKDEN